MKTRLLALMLVACCLSWTGKQLKQPSDCLRFTHATNMYFAAEDAMLLATNGIIGTNSFPEATVTITRELATNWTGYTFNSNELGYVITNHVAAVVYQQATNVFTLKNVASERAVWRTNQTASITITNLNWYVATNYIYPNIWMTNRYVLIH